MNKIHLFFLVFHIHTFKLTRNHCQTSPLFFNFNENIISFKSLFWNHMNTVRTLRKIPMHPTVFSTDLACTACTDKSTDLARAEIT